jgi:hypothetical protein
MMADISIGLASGLIALAGLFGSSLNSHFTVMPDETAANHLPAAEVQALIPATIALILVSKLPENASAVTWYVRFYQFQQSYFRCTW